MKNYIRKIQMKSVSLNVLTLFLGFILCFTYSSHGANAQSKDEIVTQLLQNNWVKKYRRIKTDMENKASNLKDSHSEEEIARLKDDYNRTSTLMEKWIESLTNELRNEVTLQNMLNSTTFIPENLKEELEVLYGFYEDNFNTTYEQLTGVNQNNLVVNFSINSKESAQQFSKYTSMGLNQLNFKKDLTKHLEPNSWKLIY